MKCLVTGLCRGGCLDLFGVGAGEEQRLNLALQVRANLPEYHTSSHQQCCIQLRSATAIWPGFVVEVVVAAEAVEAAVEPWEAQKSQNFQI